MTYFHFAEEFDSHGMGLDWSTGGWGIFEPDNLVPCMGWTRGLSGWGMNRRIVTWRSSSGRIDRRVTLDAFLGGSWHSRRLICRTFTYIRSHLMFLSVILMDG